MITKKDNPVEWAMLNYELDDAVEHLQDLSRSLNHDPDFDEIQLQIHLAHVYSHLNRLWHQRNHIGDVSDKARKEYSRFPADVEPLG